MALVLSACLSWACERQGPPRVHDIQGTGGESAHEGTEVSLEGVAVTAVGDRGFFIQEPADRADDDVRTSEGLYVYGDAPDGLEAGDRVALRGRVVEFHGHTQLKPTAPVRVTGAGRVPGPTELPGGPEADLEALESMRVSVRDGLIVSPSDEHGEVRIAPDGNRPLRLAGSPGLRTLPEMDPAGLGGTGRLLASPRGFSAEGVLAYRYGDFILWPTRLKLGGAPDLPRPVRAAAAGELTVASYNLRLFYDEVRVADEPVVDAGTFRDRLSKHAGWLERVLRCPDVVAVQEIETPRALSRLAAETGCEYRAFAGDDRTHLALGYLIAPDVELEEAVHPLGAGERMAGSGGRLFDRPPLKAVIDTPAGPVTLINVHLRSMRGLGREPRVTVKRRAQADALHRLVRDARGEDGRVMVLGDFNALPFDDGHVDVLDRVAGPDGPDRLVSAWKRLPRKERYSYLYRGHGQLLDHALLDPRLAGRITDVAFARGNVDAPAARAADAGTLLRASDHDPFVVFFRMGN